MNDFNTFDVNPSELESEWSFCERVDNLEPSNHQFEETENVLAMDIKSYLDSGTAISIDSRYDNNNLAGPEIPIGFWSETEVYQPCLIGDENFDYPIGQDFDHLPTADLDDYKGEVYVGKETLRGTEVFLNSNFESDFSNAATLIDTDTKFGLEYITDYKFDQPNCFLGEAKWENQQPIGAYLDSPINQSFNDLSESELITFPHLLNEVNPIYEDNYVGVIEAGEINTNWPIQPDMGFVASDEKLSLGLDNTDLVHLPEFNDRASEDLFISDWSRNEKSSFKSYDYDLTFIEELSKIDKSLAEIYKGAIEIQDIKPSDYKRHVADGFRELISKTIEILEPQDKILKEWLLKTNRKNLLYEKNRKQVPTRKAKFVYIFKDYSKRERKLVEDEAKCINRLYNILNGPTHSLTTDISEELLDNYVQKVKNSLKTLILLYNN